MRKNRGVNMATKMIMPMLGQTMEEGTITKWLKKEGDPVEKGEPLLEVMTDKVNMEVESPVSGILRKIIAKEDDTVPIMAPIAIIGSADEPIDDLLESGAAPETAEESKVEQPAQEAAPSEEVKEISTVSTSKIIISPRARKLAEDNGIPIEALAGLGTGPNGRITEKDVQRYLESGKGVKATQLAASIASKEGIDLAEVAGTGPQGRVVRDDVLKAMAASQVAAAVPSGEEQVIPFTGIRKMVADNVAKSAQTAPHVTLVMEVDMTEAVNVRSQIIADFEKKYGVRLSYTEMIMKAMAAAVNEVPLINARLQGNELRIPSDVNISVAVAVEGALIVPVVHKVNQRGIADICVELKSLSAKAREGKLSADELAGGTITISNLGTYGVDSFNPIITPGQTAIMGVCRIKEKPVVKNGQITIASMMNLCMSFDHRVLDGAPAAQYLRKVKELLESPWQLII